MLQKQPQLLLLSEERLEAGWERLAGAVAGYEPWEQQLQDLVQFGPPAQLARVLAAGMW